MNLDEISEFRTTWNNELFRKNRSTFIAAKRLIRKSIVIAQIRLCRQLKYAENSLTMELQFVEHDRDILKKYQYSNSLAEDLQQRLKVLENEINNYNVQLKSLFKHEKEYWKRLEQVIAKKTNFNKISTNKLKSSENLSGERPVVLVNATFVMHADKNNENLPPLECNTCETKKKSPVKIPKIRRKKTSLS